MIAHCHAAYAFTDLYDNSCAFMTQYCEKYTFWIIT